MTVERSCEWCFRALPTTGQPKRYCNRKCQVAAYNARRRAAYRAEKSLR